MSIRRVFIPVALALTLLMQFLPGLAFAAHPVAAASCDWAQFIADVTIPDGTSLAPGATFTKTWRLENIGTCTWTTSYSAVFVSGDQMSAPASVNLPSSVAPGGTVDISVNMTAPASAGHYRGNWELRNGWGGLFGVGASANSIFWVDIYTNGTYTGGTSYDFMANSCSASWSSGAGALPCPGTDGDSRGFVLNVANPQLEDGSYDSNPGLVVHPQYVYGGYIQGVYPAYTVHSGDHFQGIINCAYGASNCYVNFRLNYQINGSGPVYTFWSFNERYDGLYYRFNLDLSSLAGQSVNFILYSADVGGHGWPSGDRAEWAETKIVGNSGPWYPVYPSLTCNRGYFVSDVTIPDGTVLAPGASFTKTWEIRNIGSCTWSTSYALVHVFGSQIGAPDAVNLPSAVAPGQTADLSVNMVAPNSPGHYRSYWRLRDASGNQFGVGSGMITFFADINVSGWAPTSTVGPTATTGPTPTPTPVPTSTTVPTATPTAIIPGPNADLSITINDGLMTYTPGGTATYTVVASNSGPYDVTGATITVNKPVQITSWTVTCVADSGATCTAGPITPAGNISDVVNLPIGKKVTYTIVATINASAVGNMVTTATVTNPAPTPDPNMANNSASDTDAPPSADLAITITDGISMWTPGGSTTYKVVVTNNGPLNVTGATFTDNIPVQVTSWNWTCVPDSGASCGSGSGGNIIDSVNIPATKKVTYTIVASLGTTTPGNLVNTVTITPPIGMPDPILSNNSATDTDTGPSADLAVTKTDGVTYYNPGGTLTYTIRVSNNGPQTVIGATFADNIPSQIAMWTWTCVPDFSSTCTAGPVIPGNFSDTINLAAGQGVTYTVQALVNGAATGNLVNSASITAPGAIPDPNPGNNVATDTDAPPTADLAATMNDGLSIYPPGGTVTYTIVITNNGPAPVTGATIVDNRPTQLDSWIWTCVPDSGAACTAGPVSPVNFGDTVNIPAGKKITYTVVATVDIAATGDMTNSVTVTAPVTVPDPILGNNTATHTDAHPSADLAVAMTDMVNTYVAGGTVIYTITVTNNGPSNVTSAAFSDTAPAQLASWTWSCAADLGASCVTGTVPGGGVFTDTVNIPAGKHIVYTVTAVISGSASGTMTNTATITAPLPAFPDPNSVNNSASDIDTP